MGIFNYLWRWITGAKKKEAVEAERKAQVNKTDETTAAQLLQILEDEKALIKKAEVALQNCLVDKERREQYFAEFEALIPRLKRDEELIDQLNSLFQRTSYAKNMQSEKKM